MAYKYPQARKFFVDLAVTCSAGEVQELLTVGIDFFELRIIKIEAEYPVPSLGRVVATLEDQQPTSVDIPASPKRK